MNTRQAIRLLTIFVLTLALAAFPGVSSHLFAPAHAQNAPQRGTDGTQWVPAGPMVDKLQIQVYTDEQAEYAAMAQNPPQLDLGDWPLPSSLISQFVSDSRFFVTAPNSEFGMFDIDFNHALSFFGAPDNFGNSVAGIEFRQAVAHLIDKQQFISKVIGGLANPMDNAVPPGQSILHAGLPCDNNSPNGAFDPVTKTCSATASNSPYSFGGYNLVGSCAWETIASLKTGCLSAFHQAADAVDSFGIVTASASNPDFCAAAQHLINAGFTTGITAPNAADCSVGGHFTAFTGTNPVIVWVRSDNAPRTKLGNALIARLCELINGAGTTSCSQIAPSGGTIAAAVGAVFATGSISTKWHLYTAGWGLGSQFDQLFALYNSAFASNACGGHKAQFGQDYIYYCRSDFDHFTNIMEFNDTYLGALASAQMAMQIFGQTVATIPIWSNSVQVPYVNTWTGINDFSGTGPSNFFSIINGWNSNPALAGTLRWGFKQGTVNLNPFLVTTVWEAYVESMIYDSLVATAPYNATVPFSWLASSFTTVDASASAQCASVTGTIRCMIFNLRPNVFFHDGVALTGNDVKFSMLAFKEIPGPTSSSVAGVLDVTYVGGPSPGTDSVFIHLNSKSPFAIFNVGGVPIIPQHIWAQTTTSPCPGTVTGPLPTTGPCFADTTKAALDPVTNHIMIGSGAFLCKDIATGAVGGGCTLTASGSQGTQAVDAGGTILLQRFGFGFPGYQSQNTYFHGSRFYKQFLWGDHQTPGSIDIFDISDAGGCWNKPVSTNPGCAHWVSPAATVSCTTTAGSCDAGSLTNTGLGGNNEAQISIAELSELGSIWQVSWNQPIVYSTFFGAQPVPQALYEGGITYSGQAP